MRSALVSRLCLFNFLDRAYYRTGYLLHARLGMSVRHSPRLVRQVAPHLRALHRGGVSQLSQLSFNTTSPPVLTALYTRFGLSYAPNTTVDELLVAAKQAINRGDCVLTQTGTSVSGFSTHLGWKYWDAKVSKYQFCREVPSTLTYMTTLPQCIAGLAPRVLTADAFVGSNKYICGLVGSVHRQCNWNVTETNAQVCEAHPPFCGMCYNSTLCVELRGLSANQCAAAVQCQLQNGTFVTLTGADRATLTARCRSLMSCSELCRDPATQALRPCVDAQECTSLAGSCVDDSALWHYTGSARAPGACLLPITADSPCGLTYSQYNNTVMYGATPYGAPLRLRATHRCHAAAVHCYERTELCHALDTARHHGDRLRRAWHNLLPRTARGLRRAHVAHLERLAHAAALAQRHVSVQTVRRGSVPAVLHMDGRAVAGRRRASAHLDDGGDAADRGLRGVGL